MLKYFRQMLIIIVYRLHSQIFAGLYKAAAGILSYAYADLCKMSEKMQARCALRRQPIINSGY